MPTTVLELPKTKTVKYSLKPLNGHDQIAEINPHKFAHQFNFEWHDDLLIEDGLVISYQKMKKELPALANGYMVYAEQYPNRSIDETLITLEQMPFLPKLMQIQQEKIDIHLKEIETILPNLVVCEIDPRVGKGVFWQGPGTIKKGTAIACYAGIMGAALPRSSNFSGYGYTFTAHPLFKNHSDGSRGVINGVHGNISRFIQHLPEAETFSKHFKLDPSLQQKDIATANVEAVNFIQDGMPLVILIANREIPPNSQIGYNYSGCYWSTAYRHLQIEPLLFNNKSEILEPSKYERLYLNLNLGDTTVATPLVTLMESILKDKLYTVKDINTQQSIPFSVAELTRAILNELVRQKPAPNTIQSHFFNWLIRTTEAKNLVGNYQNKFTNTIHTILLKYWLINTLNEEQSAKARIPYIEAIMNAITESMSADELFLAVRKQVDYTESRSFYIQRLQAMRGEITNAMKIYNADKSASKTSSLASPAVQDKPEGIVIRF